jgi:gamma-glutamyltranspeptidase/glutathione hydrolase
MCSNAAGGRKLRLIASARAGLALLVLLLPALAGCGASDAVFGSSVESGNPGFVRGFLGGVVADEPNAALVGREVLSAGGTAADAATALGFALAVTYPSRASLGGGGACLVYDPPKHGPGRGHAEALLFLPGAPSTLGAGDRPAALPMLARGLFALQAKYGNRRFESLITPAEQMARLGVTVSRALAADLAVVAGPLAADPAAAGVFEPKGTVLRAGDQLLQPGLGGTLAELRVSGVGDLYQGQLANTLADAAQQAGGRLTAADLRAAIPKYTQPIEFSSGDDIAAFLPPPADGGLATAVAYNALQHDPTALGPAGAAALAAASRFRAGGATASDILAATSLPPADLPPLPASTTFGVIDQTGEAVVCALTMNNLFGTGRIAVGTGIVLAASPAAVAPPLLAAGMIYNTNLPAFRALAGGSGQAGAPLAAALALRAAERAPAGAKPPDAPDPGRANVIACPKYLPGAAQSCSWHTDPRGFGLAVGSSE